MKESMGWIKVNRRLLENPISNKPAYISLWIHLLLMANHQESSFIWNNKKEVLKKGQLLTGIKVLAKKTGIAEGTVYRILKYLENEKQIEQQKTTKFTVITIVNWCKYQENEEQNAKQIKNRLKTDRKQNKTYKNDKNEENDENDIPKGKGTPLKGNTVNLLQKALKDSFPIPLTGITDRKKLHNLIQVLSPRKGTDEWMDTDWKSNFVTFLNLYLEATDEKYYVRSVDSLKERVKLWREYRGKLN